MHEGSADVWNPHDRERNCNNINGELQLFAGHFTNTHNKSQQLEYLFYARDPFKNFHALQKNAFEILRSEIPILWLRKLRQRKVKELAKGHTANLRETQICPRAG